MSITFPVHDVDDTEQALFDAFALADVFRHALIDARTPGRAVQLRERLAAVVEEFSKVENEAGRRGDALCKDGGAM